MYIYISIFSNRTCRILSSPVVYLPVSLCPETQQEDRANPSTRLNLAGSFLRRAVAVPCDGNNTIGLLYHVPSGNLT